MSTVPRVPSPEIIRQSMDDLRRGKLSPIDHETREEVLNLAQIRIEAVLSNEVRALLAQYSPQLLEAYGLLLRWQAERDQYPPSQEEEVREGTTDETQEPVTLTTPISQSSTDQQSVSQQRGSGFQVQVPPGQDPTDAIYQAAAGPLIAMHQLSQITHQQSITFQAGTTMTLDAFQGAYKGLVTITEGKGNKAKSGTETIAVHRDIYVNELARERSVVEHPAYWLPKLNRKTVYFPDDEYGVEVGWLLGDYNPQSTGIPVGTKPTPEQIVTYLRNPDKDDHWYYDVIKAHLRTPQQKMWLEQHDLTLQDILHGHTPVHLSPQLVQIFFQDWNAKLGEHMFGF